MNFAPRNTFSILFYIHRSKSNKKGEHPIYCRLTVQKKIKEFSTQMWIQNNKWNPSASKILGTNEDAKTANHSLNSIRLNLLNIRADLQTQGKQVTSENVINIHLGKTGKRYTILELHKYYNEEHIKKLIGTDYAFGRYCRYKTSLDHVISFMKYKYKICDIPIEELSFSFITDYEFYLKTVNKCCHNTSVKYIKNLNAIMNFAVLQEWIKNNPFARYRAKLHKVDKEYLTEDELTNIENKLFDNVRLNEVRDAFIFCCYTGLS